jgi:hypothetical protein
LVELGDSDDGGVHDRAPTQSKATFLKDAANLGEDGLPQLMPLEQVAELQDRRRIGHRLASEVDAHEAAQRRRVVKRFFARLIGQVEPVLQQVDAQHALQADGWPPASGLGVVRLDQPYQPPPRHQRLHLGQEHIAPRGLAVLLEPRRTIGGRQRHLLHRLILASPARNLNARRYDAEDLISVSLADVRGES